MQSGKLEKCYSSSIYFLILCLYNSLFHLALHWNTFYFLCFLHFLFIVILFFLFFIFIAATFFFFHCYHLSSISPYLPFRLVLLLRLLVCLIIVSHSFHGKIVHVKIKTVDKAIKKKKKNRIRIETGDSTMPTPLPIL